ncbi:MAG: glycerate kinase type-2 family protein [Promethearchaeota archaeon]
MFIKNTSEILLRELDKDQFYLSRVAIDAVEKVIKAVQPRNLIENSVRLQGSELIIKDDIFDLKNFKRILIIGGGKATAEMAISLEKLVLKHHEIDYSGIINVPKGTLNVESFKKSKIKINFASHPVPDENGLNGTKMMMNIIEKSKQDDLIICLISGGGSALLPLPKTEITLQDLQITNSLLLGSGASIHEINTIRKHLSDFKGGNLANNLFNYSKATLISLIISDVVGDNLDSIASGPTVPDSTTFKDANEILQNYGMEELVPNSVSNYLKLGLKERELETPKFGDPCFRNVNNYLIGSIKVGTQEIIKFLEKERFEVSLFSDRIEGEAREFGKSLYRIISRETQSILSQKGKIKRALIGTGELTVTIKGRGIGGRNQEMLLSFLNHIKEKELHYNFLLLGGNLDGKEGNSDAMGALIDNFVLTKMIRKNLDTEKFLNSNDSNSFFRQMNSEIITGPTGCNVNDLVLILVHKN